MDRLARQQKGAGYPLSTRPLRWPSCGPLGHDIRDVGDARADDERQAGVLDRLLVTRRDKAEAQACRTGPVAIVGGGTSAGQAALFLSRS